MHDKRQRKQVKICREWIWITTCDLVNNIKIPRRKKLLTRIISKCILLLIEWLVIVNRNKCVLILIGQLALGTEKEMIGITDKPAIINLNFKPTFELKLSRKCNNIKTRILSPRICTRECKSSANAETSIVSKDNIRVCSHSRS